MFDAEFFGTHKNNKFSKVVFVSQILQCVKIKSSQKLLRSSFCKPYFGARKKIVCGVIFGVCFLLLKNVSSNKGSANELFFCLEEGNFQRLFIVILKFTDKESSSQV